MSTMLFVASAIIVVCAVIAGFVLLRGEDGYRNLVGGDSGGVFGMDR